MEPTYAFNNGSIETVLDGKVVASAKEADFIEPDGLLDDTPSVELPDPPDELQEDMLADISECPSCGDACDASDSFCSKCGEPLSDTPGDPEEDLGFDGDLLNARMVAKVAKVSTPNGLEGKVINRTPTLWGDEVTVRFSNGQVKTMPVTAGMKFSEEEEAPAENPADALRIRLNASVTGDMDSLLSRKDELKKIQVEAASRIQSASPEQRTELDLLIREAKAEAQENADAIQHLTELEGRGFIPTSSFQTSAVEQASIGAGDGSWLHEVTANMEKEAASTDFVKLLNEGPETFIAGADDALVSNAGASRQAAARHVRSFTSAAVSTTTEAQRKRFENQFLARVEDCRRAELASRKKVARKEASSVANDATSALDDALFL